MIFWFFFFIIYESLQPEVFYPVLYDMWIHILRRQPFPSCVYWGQTDIEPQAQLCGGCFIYANVIAKVSEHEYNVLLSSAWTDILNPKITQIAVEEQILEHRNRLYMLSSARVRETWPSEKSRYFSYSVVEKSNLSSKSERLLIIWIGSSQWTWSKKESAEKNHLPSLLPPMSRFFPKTAELDVASSCFLIWVKEEASEYIC